MEWTPAAGANRVTRKTGNDAQLLCGIEFRFADAEFANCIDGVTHCYVAIYESRGTELTERASVLILDPLLILLSQHS